MKEKATHMKLLCRPANHEREDFPGDHASVTFVGRPFPLEEAHEHFCRLRRWGLTFSTYICKWFVFIYFSSMNVVRFLVTWEAVEHAGP